MAEAQFHFREEAPVTEPAIPLIAFGAQASATAVRLEPGDDPRALLPHLARLRLVEVHFPIFTDGRGYSAAQILREAGYRQELRAVGDIGVDQLAHLRRCGFDAIAPAQVLDAEDARAALARWPEVYQSAADGRVPIWALRHGMVKRGASD